MRGRNRDVKDLNGPRDREIKSASSEMTSSPFKKLKTNTMKN